VISFYRWLQRGLQIELPMENDEDLFYAHRDRFNALLATEHGESREAAGLFYYLNRTGFNGLCRFNRSGVFNVPFGRYNRINYLRDFGRYRDLLTRWHFTSSDATSIPIERDDFVYADPPYDVNFRQYESVGFTWEDQERTAIWLSRHHGPTVLVNQATPRIESLYRNLGYVVSFLEGPRRISRTGDRTPAREILATRNM
jgi:DNA adenine methylase